MTLRSACPTVSVAYRVYAFNISLDHIVRWKSYLENQSRAFIQRSYGQGERFHSVIRDYVRLLLLHRYGGTFLGLDTVILRPLPNTEFIESGGNGTCCALNTTGLYEASDLMRFRPRRLFLWEIFRADLHRSTENHHDERQSSVEPFNDDSCLLSLGHVHHEVHGNFGSMVESSTAHRKHRYAFSSVRSSHWQ